MVYAAGLKSLDYWRGDYKDSSIDTNVHKAFLCAKELVATAKQRFQEHDSLPLIRVGCASSTVFGGIISRYKFAYDIFGHAMDCAEMLASVGSPLSLSLSADMAQLAQKDIQAILGNSSEQEESLTTTGEIILNGNNVKYITLNVWK